MSCSSINKAFLLVESNHFFMSLYAFLNNTLSPLAFLQLKQIYFYAFFNLIKTHILKYTFYVISPTLLLYELVKKVGINQIDK